MDKNNIKKIVIFLIGFLVMMLFSMGMYIFINSDYFKSRKVVDTDWMIGKTMDEIARRYSYPPDSLEGYMGDHSPYVLCAREIFLYDPWDGMQGQYMYYALLDDNGRVIDVKTYAFGGEMPPEDYAYEDRW